MFSLWQKNKLHSHHLYRSEIERLYEMRPGGHGLVDDQHQGVSLTGIAIHANRFSKLLAKSVRSGEYEFHPATVRDIQVEGKKRRVLSLVLPDSIVHRAVTTMIADAMEPRLSRSLYSYRQGVSWWSASSNFAHYVREHYRQSDDIRTRGLYIMRRDVDSYTDTIPVHDESPLWSQLRGILDQDDRTRLGQQDWDIVHNVVRPVVENGSGQNQRMDRGVPTGQPISCVIFNLYLHEVDHVLAGLPGVYYARYCDDLLLAHPDPNVVREADALLTKKLDALDLSAKKEKGVDLFLNRAGRAGVRGYAGAKHVDFVGLRTDAHGTISLSKKKSRRLLTDLTYRARNAMRLVSGSDTDRIGRAVCDSINSALDPNRPSYHQKTANLLRKAITNREQLAELDYSIARIVLRTVLDREDVRGFRQIPYRKIRSDWGLVSLEHARNRWGSRSR